MTPSHASVSREGGSGEALTGRFDRGNILGTSTSLHLLGHHLGKLAKSPEAKSQNRLCPTPETNLTDKESRIMPVSSGGFDQYDNAQASVDIDTMLIVSEHLTQNPNDKLEIYLPLRH